MSTAPRLPPVLITPSASAQTMVAATLDAVDDITTPTRATFIVDGSLPALSGFVWNNSLKVTVAEAPSVPAAPPVGTVYFNNHTTHKGGTIFFINTISRTVISTTSNFSTVAGVDYSQLFQDITHDGAFNPTGKFQNPNPLDIRSFLGNPALTVAPILVPPLPPSYGFTFIGANGVISSGGAYDARLEFNTLLTNPTWMQEVRLYVNPNGTMADNIPSPDKAFIHKTTLQPDPAGNYTAWVHGLVAGEPYDIYVAYVDNRGEVGYGRYLGTTPTMPVQLNVGSLLSMGDPSLVTPVVISHALDLVENGQAGATAFDYLVPTVVLDSLGYGSNQWLVVIELVYRNRQKPNNLLYSNSVSVKTSGTYDFNYPQLPVGINSDGTNILYDLGVRYVDNTGQRSNTLFFDSVGAATLQVGSATLQTIPAGTTFSVDFSGISQVGPVNNGGGTFAQPLRFNLNINSSVPYTQWLDKIQLLAKEQPTGVPDSDQNPANYIKCGQINGSLYTNPLDQSFGPLGNNSTWQLAIQLIDHSGVFTQALPIYICGFQQTPGWIGPGSSNVNFISDSDMAFTNNFGGLGAIGSVYWTYAGLDPTRFHTMPYTAVGSYLTCDAHLGPSKSGCAYSDIIQVIIGQTYTLSVMANGNNTSYYCGIVDKSDKDANNVTPSNIYASATLKNTGTLFTQSFSWTATLTGPISVALWATGITGVVSWFHPQFELGSVATSYKSGTAITEASATIAHGASPSAMQSVINASAQVRVDNVQSGSRLPLPAHATQVNDVVTDNGSGRGTLNVNPAGSVTGNLPYSNHNSSVQSVINSGGTYNAGTATGTLPYGNHSTAITAVITSGGNYNAGTATGTLPYGNHSTAITGVISASGTIPTSGSLNQQASILGIPDLSTLSWTSDTSSITFSWGNILVYFPNGSVETIAPGSQVVSGLTTNCNYNAQIYYNFNAAAMSINVYVLGGGLTTAQIVAANADGCVDLSNKWSCATTSSGTASGGQPFLTSCPSVDQLIRTMEIGQIRAEDVEVGMHVYCTPENKWVVVQRKVVVDGYICKLKLGSEEFEVDMNHHMLKYDGNPHRRSNDWIPVYELTRNTLLQGLDDVPISVRSIGEEYPGKYVELTVDGNVYDLGQSVVHNIMTAG